MNFKKVSDQTKHVKMNLKSPSDFTDDPNSPPETPTTPNRKTSLKPRRQPDFHDYLQPVGDGHQFSNQSSLGPRHQSPRSTPSSEAVEDTSDEDDDSGSPGIRSLTTNEPGPGASADPANSDADMSGVEDPSDDDDSDSDSDKSGASDDAETSHLTTTTTVTCNFTLEDVDPMDSDCDGLDVLYPTEIESNPSRSRSGSRELDKDMIEDFRNLKMKDRRNSIPDSEASDNEHPDYDEEEMAFYRRCEQRRRFRRMRMGSNIGKRTHSELSDSHDNGETLDVNDAGFTARHMQRKLQRTSLLFHDPPPARIDELDEPDSSKEDVIVASHDLT